ncbi:hypothetical protein JCM3770_005346 [Rhodotorula araucariae]
MRRVRSSASGALPLALFHAVWPESSDPMERRLVRKVDALVLSYLCLNFCVNFINAYVSGLREELQMHGSQFNNVVGFFTAGFAVAQIPQNLLLLIVPPRILFPLNGVLWGALTMLSAAVTTVEQLYVVKFFQGMAEASTFVGAHYILGAWYHPHELGKRAAIFAASAQAASLFSGALQGALYRNLDGAHGIDGWQWLFLVCGALTIPVALYGVFLFPDTPHTTRSRFFTPEERALAISRRPPRQHTSIDRTLLRRVFGRWEVYLMSLIWIAGGALESYGAWGIMAIWMKAQLSPQGTPFYTVQQLNHYPLGLPAVAITALLLTAVWTDRRTRDRFAVNLVVALGVFISAVLVLVGGLRPGRLPRGAMYFAFYLSGISFAGQMSNFSWANELLAHDEQARSVVLATMNVMSYAFNAWFQVVFFKASSAPAFTQGSSLILAFVPLMAIFTCAARYLQLRDQRSTLCSGAGEKRESPPVEGEGDADAGSVRGWRTRPGTATTDATIPGVGDEKGAANAGEPGGIKLQREQGVEEAAGNVVPAV